MSRVVTLTASEEQGLYELEALLKYKGKMTGATTQLEIQWNLLQPILNSELCLLHSLSLFIGLESLSLIEILQNGTHEHDS